VGKVRERTCARYNKAMNRFRALLLFALLFVSFVPALASAQSGFPLFDPTWQLVPDPSLLDESCEPDDPLAFGAVLQLVQNTMNLAVALTALILIGVIVYAGALFMSAAANAEGISKAKSTFMNAAVGFLIVIAAWLVVDSLMKVFYVGETGNDANFLPWNQIFTGGPACIQKDPNQKSLFQNLKIGEVPTVRTGVTLGEGGTRSTEPLSTTGKGACNSSTIASAAASGGVRMSAVEANTIACLAGPESQCGVSIKNYNWDGVKSKPPSTAYGPFQITLKGNSNCFDNTTCSAAAGVSESLNCKAAFTSAGYSIPGAKLEQCKRAAANLACSAVAAHCVYQAQGSKAWTQDKSSAKQKACITKYGG